MKVSLYTVLGKFVQNPRHRTLLIKGKWGVGKTHAVREFFLGGDSPAMTVSYVSLSGVSKVADERWLVVSGLELDEGQPAWEKWSVRVAEVAKAATKMIPLGAGGVADVGVDALVNFLSNRVIKGAIVVLDDIERKEESLALSAIFGAVSRLTEIRGAKVIVIMNEDQLLRVDHVGSELLSSQREKIFDREFEFRPSIDEALELVDLRITAQYVNPVARKLHINNLRILQKIAWAVEELDEHLGGLDSVVKTRILSQVAQIASIRFRARCPLNARDLESGSHFQFVDALKKRTDPSLHEPDNPFRSDLESLDYEELPVDTILLEFLETGSFDTKTLQAALPSLTALHAEEGYHKLQEQVSHSIWGTFRRLDAHELDRIEQLLDGDYVGRLSHGSLEFYERILELHDRSGKIAECELRWVDRVSDREIDFMEIRPVRLRTAVAQERMVARMEMKQDPDAPRTFEEALAQGRLSLRFLRSAQASDTAVIEQILRTSERDVVTDASRLLLHAQTTESQWSELLPPFIQAFQNALDRLCVNNEMNKIRVESIRSSSRQNQ